jgi:hypothetical protein
VGPVTITQQNLVLARSPEQSLCMVTTAAGSSSADSIGLLARSVRDATAQRATVDAS